MPYVDALVSDYIELESTTTEMMCINGEYLWQKVLLTAIKILILPDPETGGAYRDIRKKIV